MKAINKIIFLNLILYLVGAIVWGILLLIIEAIKPIEFLHIFTSAAVLIIAVFFFIVYFTIKNVFKKIEDYELSDKKKSNSQINRVIRNMFIFIFLNALVYGIVGPLMASLALYFPNLGFFIKETSIDQNKLFLLVMMGEACCTIIFIPLIQKMYHIIEENTQHIAINNQYILPIKFRLSLISIISLLGAILLIVSTTINISLQYNGNENFLNILITKLIIISLIVISLSLINFLIASNQFLKPIHGITRTILEMFKDIAKGKANLTKQLKINTRNELGIMSNALNDFIQYIRDIILKINNMAQKTKQISTDLSTISSEVSSSMKDISSIITTISSQTKNLDEKVLSSSKSVDEITTYISRVNELIENLTSSVDESSSSVEEILASIGNIEKTSHDKIELSSELDNTTQTGSQKINNLREIISKITESTKIMLEAIAVINNISAKTNLLAMNAAIEAAHAGEKGKGFSVVAAEIRNLAENAAVNSKSISKSLKDVVINIDKTESTSKEAAHLFGEINTGISDVADSMHEIKTAIAELAIGGNQVISVLKMLIEQSAHVENSSKLMGTKINDVSSIIKNLNTISVDTKNGMIEMEKGINDILLSITNLSNISIKNDDSITSLEDLIQNIEV